MPPQVKQNPCPRVSLSLRPILCNAFDPGHFRVINKKNQENKNSKKRLGEKWYKIPDQIIMSNSFFLLNIWISCFMGEVSKSELLNGPFSHPYLITTGVLPFWLIELTFDLLRPALIDLCAAKKMKDSAKQRYFLGGFVHLFRYADWATRYE